MFYTVSSCFTTEKPNTYSHRTNTITLVILGLRDIPDYCIAPTLMLSFVGHAHFSFLFSREETKFHSSEEELKNLENLFA